MGAPCDVVGDRQLLLNKQNTQNKRNGGIPGGLHSAVGEKRYCVFVGDFGKKSEEMLGWVFVWGFRNCERKFLPKEMA